MRSSSAAEQQEVDMIKAAYPNIYVLNLPIFENTSSMTTPMSKQLEAVVDAIQTDENLKNGFNFYGVSQVLTCTARL